MDAQAPGRPDGHPGDRRSDRQGNRAADAKKNDLKPWIDKNGNPWLDPHQRVVWQYAADLAREAYEVGFSEVQFDYVRFPDEKRLMTEAVYPLANGRSRSLPEA